MPARPKPTFSALRSMVPFLAAERTYALLALAALIVAALATLAIPQAVRRVVDFGFKPESRGLVDAYFGMIVGLTALLAVSSSLRYYFVMTIGERVVSRIRQAVFARVMSLDGAFFDSARSGEIVSRLTADTTQLKATFGASASVALRNIILLVGAITMMVITSPKLAGMVLLAIPAIVFPLVAAGRGVRKRSKAAQDQLAEAASFATERIGAVRVVQGLGGEASAVARFADAVNAAYEAARAATLSRAFLTSIVIFLVFASITFVLWTGAKAVIADEMSPGRLSQFVLYAVFAASGLGQLSEVYGELTQAAGAAERLGDLLATEPVVKEPDHPVAPMRPARGTIEYSAVSFAYPTAPARQVLGPLNLSIAAGERLAIVGPSGAGKTSLFQVLMRFYDVTEGSIRIDGVPIGAMRLADLRSLMASVPQDPVIFAGTIGENIRLARPAATDVELRLAAEQAAVLAFADKLPDGLETRIGERGITLSGGERQRIAIARAILRDAPILLLDEATSALDAENERAVQEALTRAMNGRTALVIAHRLATIRNADRILVIDGGRIVEQGTHEALLAAEGTYARLASLQFTA
ncbi:MdlB ABC-type multidrug transport system, ATPase and permease components [Rhabdaerophilaceae bacterium]